jgi:formylglycine-generating enzyme required for sulfatase activity/serine/threonine protein kinase
LLEVLGTGANANVFRAVQSGAMGFRKEVAVKQILPHVAGKESVVHGLINEARVAGYLRHRNIVEVYEFDQVGDTYYLAMEYVPGFALSEIIARSREQGEPLPAGVVTAIAAQICDGLQCAHEALGEKGQPLGMVHRDIKPGNVMVTLGGVVKLMDFGVVKAASNLFTTSSADVTKGTPIYMSPEQVRGLPLDGRSDVFGLGSVIAELITGQVAFLDGDLMAVLHKVDRAEIDGLLAQVEIRMPAMVPILRLALQKVPDDRFPSAQAMAAAIRRVDQPMASDEELGEWLGSFMPTRPRLAEVPEEGRDDDPVQAQIAALGNLGALLNDEEYGGAPVQEMPDTLPPLPEPIEMSAPRGATLSPATPGFAQLSSAPVFRHRIGIDMVRVPPAELWMGSAEAEVGRCPDEVLHKVALTRPFLLATTPVTQDLWEKAMGDNPAWTMASDHPVESIDWFQAVAFCNRLSEMEGLALAYRIDGDDVSWDRDEDGFRLSTEAEWEAAARGGEPTRFAGSDSADEVAWHWRNTGGLTHEVACLQPNPLGLYDMSGNVSEWVWDWYGPYPSRAEPTADPHGPLHGQCRVHRGGSAFNLPADVRVARRHGEDRPVDHYNFLGLRVARSIVDGR